MKASSCFFNDLWKNIYQQYCTMWTKNLDDPLPVQISGSYDALIHVVSNRSLLISNTKC